MVFSSFAMTEEPVLNLQLQARLEEAAARLSGERGTVWGRGFVDHWSVRQATESHKNDLSQRSGLGVRAAFF